MYCMQCEQSAKGTACTTIGVCGKQPEVAALQDLLLYMVKGLSRVAVEGRKVGVNDDAVNRFTCKAIFSTLTNVDFDGERFVSLIGETTNQRDRLKQQVESAGGSIDSDGPVSFQPGSSLEAMTAQGETVGIMSDPDMDPDLLSLREVLVYGVKGLAAYTDHAAILSHGMGDAVGGYRVEDKVFVNLKGHVVTAHQIRP